jgi:hypothetical protein
LKQGLRVRFSSAAKILKACQTHRKRFRQLGSEVAVLIQIRENAEETLKAWDFEWTEEHEPPAPEEPPEG